MKGGSAPSSPDYAKLIPLQTAANKDIFNYMLNASRVNTISPYGSSTWSSSPAATSGQGMRETGPTVGNPLAVGMGSTNPVWMGGESENGRQDGPVYSPGPATPPLGGTPAGGSSTPMQQWTNTQSLSPEQQKLYDLNTSAQIGQAGLLGGLGGQIGKAVQNPLDTSSLPPAYGQAAADAYYNKATRYLEPAWDQQRQTLEARLGEQGFVPGTPGYAQEMANFQRTQDLARGQASDAAILAGSQLGGAERNRALAELLTARQNPINEYNAIRGGTAVTNPNLPGQYSVPGLQAPDQIGAATQTYQNQLGASNANTASNNSLMQGLASMAAMYFMGSDRRLKTEVVRIGTSPRGYPWYSFKYVWGGSPQEGVMADEVPEGITLSFAGYKMVDYSKV